MRLRRRRSCRHRSRYLDSAWFTAAERCNDCGQWVDPEAGRRVERERAYWSEGNHPPPWT